LYSTTPQLNVAMRSGTVGENYLRATSENLKSQNH
jgi:hypothetical protein